MPSETVNETVERIREHEQPKHMNKIMQSLSVGFHLKCLRCGSTYYHTCFAMSEMSYRMYSYCPDCIDKAILLLKNEDNAKDTLIDNLSTFLAKNYEPPYNFENIGKLKWPIDYEQQKEEWKSLLEKMVKQACAQ